MIKDPTIRRVVRLLIIELVVYALLLVAYFFLVLQFLGKPLTNLFNTNLLLYGFGALALMVAQGFLLDMVTSFLLKLLRIDHID